ncbi:MAG: mandelate racemase/muconate lactonizing enzyme family protein [Propioniciclava sp.]
MRIVHVQPHILRVRAAHSYLGATVDGEPPPGYTVRAPWRSLYSDSYETVLVEVRSADGTTGWGEALTPVGPEVVAAVITSLLGPHLVARGSQGPRETWFAMRALMRERGHLGGHQADALAAVDMALWDLHARLVGLPLTQLAGGALREEIPCYLSGLPSPDPGERAALAYAAHADGVRRIKLHLGQGVDADLAVVDALLDLDLDLTLAVDAHWAYSLTDAVVLAEALADRGCWFLEAPLAPEDLRGHQQLSERTRIPIAAGEAMRHRYEVAPWLQQRALSILQPDVARTGLTEALAMAELASAEHIPLAPHHSVCSPVAFAAGVQLSRLVPDLVAFEYQPYPLDATAAVLAGAAGWTATTARLPDIPGLGIEVDAAAVRRMCVAC